MKYDCGDGFPFDIKPNGNEDCHHDYIPFNLKGNEIHLTEYTSQGMWYSICYLYRILGRITNGILTLNYYPTRRIYFWEVKTLMMACAEILLLDSVPDVRKRNSFTCIIDFYLHNKIGSAAVMH